MSMRPITEDDLHAYVDGALDPARRDEVAAYLADHADVAERIESYARQRDTLRAAFAPIAEEPVPQSLNLAHLLERRQRPTAFSTWRQLAAALVLVCVGGVAGWMLQGMTRPEIVASDDAYGVAALASEAVVNYKVFAQDKARPIEIAAPDAKALVQWASNRLKAPVSVPDLSGAGYRFMGGRLVATEHGPAVMFMYDDDKGTRLVMLSRPMARQGNSRMTESSREGVNGFTWSSGGIGYSLVGPAPADVLHPIADKARSQLGQSA